MPVAAVAVAAAFASAAAAVTAITATVVLGLTISTWLTIGAIGLSVGMAMSAAAKAKKAARGMESVGSQLQLKAAGDTAPIPIAFGRAATGGYLIYRDTTGAKNGLLAMLTVLSGGGPIDAIESYQAGEYAVTFNGDPKTQLATVTGTSPASELYAGKMRQRWLSGSASDGSPTDYAGVYLNGIGSSFKQTGYAKALVLADYDTKKYPSGLPSKNIWVIRGQRLYDPRLDSTYPGGSGPHRLGQPATYTYSANPALAALAWALGIFSNGKRVAGIGLPLEQIDVGAFVAHANICDANNWTIGGVVTTYDSKWAVLQAILECGSADPVDRGAMLSVMYDAPLASVYTLTTDDIVGQVEVTNTTPFKERKNTVSPRWRSPNSGWEIIAGETVTSSVYVGEDNGETRAIEVEYPMVTNAAQAHQLATYALANGRELLQATVVCKPHLMGVRVGECITTTIPQLALNAKKFRVMGRSLDPQTLQVTLNLRSENDAKHAFALGQSQTAPPSITFDGYDQSNPAAPSATAWSITGNAVVSATGVSSPAIVIEGASDDPNAASVIIEYRQFDAAHTVSDIFGWSTYQDTSAASTTRAEIGGVLYPDTAYQAAVSYRTMRGVVSKRLILGPVTVGRSVAGGVRDGGIDYQANTIINIPPALIPDANGKLDADWIDFGQGVVFGDIVNAVAVVNGYEQDLSDVANAEIHDAVAIVNHRAYVDTQLFDGNGIAVGAAIKNEANTRVAQDLLIANSVTALTARLVSNVATLTGLVSTEANTRVTADGVLTTQLNAVGARLDSNTVTLTSLVTSEQTARVNADGVLTTAVNTVSARLDANTTALAALVTNEVNARTSAVSAETSARNLQVSQLNANIAANAVAVTALVTTETNTRVSAVSAETSARNLQVSQLNANITANATALQSSINTEATTRANQDGVFATSFTALGAYNGTSGAFVLNKSTVQVGTDGALGTVLSGIKTTADNAASGLTSEISTRTSQDSALSTRIDNLTSTVTTNNSTLGTSISNEVTARTNADNTLGGRIDTLTSTVTTNNNTLTASISSEATTRANQDTAIAGSVSTLSTTVGGHTASISTLQSSVGGLQAQYVLTVQAGGYWSGIQLAAGGGTSSIKALATSFGVYTSDGYGGNPFLVDASGITMNSNVRINGTLVINGTIKTATMEDYAVTREVSASWDSGALPGSTGTGGQVIGQGSSSPELSVHTLTLASTGAPVNITAAVDWALSGGGQGSSGYTIYLRVKRDGSYIRNRPIAGGIGSVGTGMIFMVDNPGAGTHTYELLIQHTGGTYQTSYYTSFFGLRETKK